MTWQNQQCGCTPSEDSDQSGHPPSRIRVFAVRMKKPWVLSYPLNAQRRLWSDWANAQADLSLRWAHTHFVGFVMSWLICTFFSNVLRYKGLESGVNTFMNCDAALAGAYLYLSVWNEINGHLDYYTRVILYAVKGCSNLMPTTSFSNEPRHEKTCLRGFRPSKTQTGLLSNRD